MIILSVIKIVEQAINVYQGPKGGLEELPGPQGTPPTPILEKTLVSRNDF